LRECFASSEYVFVSVHETYSDCIVSQRSVVNECLDHNAELLQRSFEAVYTESKKYKAYILKICRWVHLQLSIGSYCYCRWLYMLFLSVILVSKNIHWLN